MAEIQTTSEEHDDGRHQLTVLDVLDVLAGELAGMYSLPDSDCPIVHRNRHGLAKQLAAGEIDADDRVILTTDKALRGRARHGPGPMYDRKRA